ncbi:MAG: methyltransferase [Rhodospirillales bacterium]|nr:methyltransferase [Rhodospirillales bacterium]
MQPDDPAAFVRANTLVSAPPLVPEIRLHLASEVVPLWQATEQELAESGLPPPFWAFAWAGGQALARYLLDNPEVARGKRVLDFAAGSGLQGIAAAKAGAARVEAAEIDDFAIAAIGLNAALNGVAVAAVQRDLIGAANPGWDLVLAGDVCYERPLAARIAAWLTDLAAGSSEVLLGDPGRSYLPKTGLERVTAYSVKTTRELEDTDVRHAVVWRVAGPLSDPR